MVVWDPRIHFGLVKGTRSCPPLQVFHPDTLDQQLDAAVREFCSRHVEVRSGSSAFGMGKSAAGAKTVIALPALFETYREDFGATDAQLVRWLAQYLPEPKQREVLEALRKDSFVLQIRAFDWSVNKGASRPSPPPAPGAAPVPTPRHLRSQPGSAEIASSVSPSVTGSTPVRPDSSMAMRTNSIGELGEGVPQLQVPPPPASGGPLRPNLKGRIASSTST